MEFKLEEDSFSKKISSHNISGIGNNTNETLSHNIIEENSNNLSMPQKEESIDKYPVNQVRYATRAIGNLLNQYFHMMGDKNEEYLNLRNDALAIIKGTLQSPFVFYIHGSSHDYFLRLDNTNLNKEGSSLLEGTDSTFMDLAKALSRMQIVLENKKGQSYSEDKVYITVKEHEL